MDFTTIISQEQYENYREIRESYRDADYCPEKAKKIRLLNKLILEWQDGTGKPAEPVLSDEDKHRLYMKLYMREVQAKKKAKKNDQKP